MVEVPVAHEEVADLLDRDARVPQPPEQDGAAGGVEEYRLFAGKPHGEAGLGPLRVQRIAGTETDHTPHGAPPALLCWTSVRAHIVGHAGVPGNGRLARTPEPG